MLDFSLIIMGNDWLVIGLVALFLILGTKRLPDASRKIGRIVGEFTKSKNVVQNEFQKAKGDFGIPIQGPVNTERQKLEVIAKTLGINCANKTDDELRNLISLKLGKSEPSSEPPSGS